MRETILIGAVLLGGCVASSEPGLRSPDPSMRLQALVEAARAGDPDAARDIIPLLDSDDAGERLLAIRTLEQLTGETFGYDHAAPPSRRQAAVEAWVRWAKEHPAQDAAPHP